jgi:hypothetical protein
MLTVHLFVRIFPNKTAKTANTYYIMQDSVYFLVKIGSIKKKCDYTLHSKWLQEIRSRDLARPHGTWMKTETSNSQIATNVRTEERCQ